VHLWDQRERETARFDVRGIVWSDAGAEDPVAGAESVWRQHEERGLVTVGDPAADGFGELVDSLRGIPLVRSVRVRLAGGLVQGDHSQPTLLEQPAVMEHFTRMARHDLVATIEATSAQLSAVTRLARELPELKIVVDHFGWPTELSEAGRQIHLERLAEFAAMPNVATRLDAIGTVFGAWTAEEVRPWLLAVVARFGPDRCLLGSDLPIERLRSGFEALYRADDGIFAEHSRRDREMLLRATVERWYGTG
jgi:predicted TIM-barrel fold metal-dependent hydrolase